MLQANLLSKEILTKNEHKEGPNLKHITLNFLDYKWKHKLGGRFSNLHKKHPGF